MNTMKTRTLVHAIIAGSCVFAATLPLNLQHPDTGTALCWAFAAGNALFAICGEIASLKDKL